MQQAGEASDDESSGDEDEGPEQQQHWRPRISGAGAGDDLRWRLEIAICSSMRGDREVLEVGCDGLGTPDPLPGGNLPEGKLGNPPPVLLSHS